MDKSEARAVVRGAKRALERLRAGGVTELPRRRAKPQDPARVAPQERPSPPRPVRLQAGRTDGGESPAVTGPVSDRQAPPATEAAASNSAEKRAAIEAVRKKALACTACRLAKERTHVVFSDGSIDAQLAFVGEGPGRDEDAQGVPFVGAAGKLLTKIIEAMGMQRQDAYICNVVKCRPPQNRPPEPDEAAACSSFLVSQLTLVRPKIIVALGRTAASALLETDAPMALLRGKTFEWQGIPLVVTFHPAYLLRNPSAKGEVWKDMQRVMEFLKSA